MTKKWVAGGVGVGAVAVVLGSWMLLGGGGKHPSPRGPASPDVSDNANIRALKAIPLMKGYERPESNEDAIAEQLIDIFSRFADRNANADGSLNRGTHAKGKCFRGSFTVFSESELASQFQYSPDVARRLKQGLFETDGAVPATLRFANADGLGRKQADTVADVRGFSFSVEAKTHRQDFMMNSTAAFATGGIHEFLELVKAANILIYKDFTYFPNLGYLPSVAKTLKRLQKGNASGGGTMSYAAQEFWANLPYSHGLDAAGNPKDIVKFKAAPCDGQGSRKLPSTEGLDADYLQREIVERARSGQVCFYLQVQFFDLEKMRVSSEDSRMKSWDVADWIENGGLLWDEKVLPFYTVAKLDIPAGDKNEIACEDQYVNTRLHADRANLPLGSIARVRTLVEETSRARRMK